MKILIAEDDITSRTVLAGVLRKAGHEVVETVDGAEALRVLQQSDAPMMAILDWMMPGMDGMEVVRRIRAQPTASSPYIIILTTRGKKADVVAGIDGGANDYLAKPFDARELCARVNVGRRMIEMQSALAAKVEELRDALDHVKTLRGIVPICMYCKKIRDDQGFWSQVEVYVRNHTEARFTHGMCPACQKQNFPEYARNDPANGKQGNEW